jgi:hypothetical protein
MERFVIGAALVVAALAVIGGVLGAQNHWSFDIDSDDEATKPAVATGKAETIASTAYAGAKVRLEDMVAIVEVTPEDRADIAVEIRNPGFLATPKATLVGDALIVNGGVNDIRKCGSSSHNGSEPRIMVGVRGGPELNGDQVPRIALRTPRAVALDANGAVWLNIGGGAQSATIALNGCGDAEIGAVDGPMKLSLAGSGDFDALSARGVELDLSGSGGVTIGSVSGPLTVSLAGSSGVDAQTVTGDLDASIAGSGDIAIEGGQINNGRMNIAGSGEITIEAPITNAQARVAGSGDINLEGVVATLDASIFGSGDINARKVTGVVKRTKLGTGDINVDDHSGAAAPAPPLTPPTPKAAPSPTP